MSKTFDKLPRDVRQYVIKKTSKIIAVCAVIELAVIIALALWGDAIMATDAVEIKIIIWMICVALPIFLTKTPRKLMDKTYLGKIIEADVSTVTAHSSSGSGKYTDMYYKNVVTATLELDDGSVITKTVQEGKASGRKNFDAYKEGRYILHIYGTKHAVLLPEPCDDKMQCAVCGETNTTSDQNCRSCGCTLIKDKDMPG